MKHLRLILTIFLFSLINGEEIVIYSTESAQYFASDCCALNSIGNQNSDILYSQDCQDMGNYYGCGMAKYVPLWSFDLSSLDATININSIHLNGDIVGDADWSGVYLSMSSMTGSISTNIASHLWSGGDNSVSGINWPQGAFSQILPIDIALQSVATGQLNILAFTSEPWQIFSIDNSGDGAPRLIIDYESMDEQPELVVEIDSICVSGWNSNALDLGTVIINDSTECTIIISNTGQADLIISNIQMMEIQNENSSTAFSVNIDSLIIEPGYQDSVVVFFNPNSAGYYDASVVFDTNDESAPTYYVHAYGVGLYHEQEIQIETDYQFNDLYYYEAQLGDSTYYEDVMISNLGNATLEIDQIITTEPFYSSVSSASLGPNESIYISIVFLPDSSGIYSGTATIHSNDSDESEYIINLYGYTERTEPGIINIATFGSDQYGNGSEGDPFATIAKGLGIAIANDTIYVKNGHYSETILWPAVSHVSLIGQSMDSTVIDGEANNDHIIDNYDYNYYPKEISNLTLQNGITPNKGGGISLKMTGELLLKDLIIRDNHADIGGGVYIEGQGSESFVQTIITFENVVIYNNHADDYGGGVALGGALISAIMKHVTVLNNNAMNVGGGISAGSISDYAVIVNSIFWNNQPSNINGMVFPYFSNIDVPVGTNNINIDPQFLNNSESFILDENSPCIDAGTDFLAIDLTGYMLPGIVPDTIINLNDQDYYGLAPDMGAIETQFFLNLESDLLPDRYILYQNYPNPFNPVTSLRYYLPKDGLVNITIYDMIGRIVKTLVNNSQTAGYRSIQWNATNDRKEPVSAGLYLYTIEAGKFRQTRKMVLVK